jgi:prevent-host-death family protein
MRTAGIADLKNNLSRYLRQVRRGEEILIRDRKAPVARIVPLSSANDFDAEELALAAAGRLRLPRKALPDSFWTPRSRGRRIPLKKLVDAVVADREERDASVLGR